MIIISVEYSNKDTRKGADPVPKTFTEASIPISQHFSFRENKYYKT